MKKIVSLLLVICMCLTVVAMLTACKEHTHTFKTEWTHDETHHWHACEGVNCNEALDKAEHTWDEGKSATEVTATADGEKTYTCTVCKATKNEAVKLPVVSEDEWQESIAVNSFDNVTVHYSIKNSQMSQEHIVKIAGDKVYRKMMVEMVDSESFTLEEVFTGEDAVFQKEMFLSVFRALLEEKDNYIWDDQEKAYISPNEVTVTIQMAEANAYEILVMTNGKVKFDTTKKLESFSCTLRETVYVNNVLQSDMVSETEWLFSDYGTTVITETAE